MQAKLSCQGQILLCEILCYFGILLCFFEEFLVLGDGSNGFSFLRLVLLFKALDTRILFTMYLVKTINKRLQAGAKTLKIKS